ncbi:ERF family protein [Paenibacillus massiliensis]|uniref:ERF family protein n=1 Tax=Paenibacillus massiliensis TaxID=225917 RepID=UPI0009FE2584|nr:ERF family protein [Paenibacillus massiliensis]
MSDEVKLNLYQKISAVMRDVEYLSKDDKVEFGNTKYKAISEEKVTATVRASLIKHGLVVLPVAQTHTKDGNLSTVDVTYKIVDIETGEHETIVSSGTGVDSQDKGVGKAMTYSYKYLFLRTFAIPTGEDPDKVSSAELDEKQRIEREKAAAADAREMKAIEIKWNLLSGNTEGMQEWIDSMLQKGHTLEQLHDKLAQRLIEKQKEK